MPLTTKPTVLIVDDAPDNLMLIKMLLQGRCHVLQADSGEQALALAQKIPGPDLILLDVLMPEMDGYAVCAQLKALPATADIPVIFLTSRNQLEDQRRGLQSGAVDYITKPINPDVLQARVSTHLQLKALRAMLKDKSVHLQHLVAERTREILLQHDASHYAQAAQGVQESAPPSAATCRLQHYVAALASKLQDRPQFAASLDDENITLLFRAIALNAGMLANSLCEPPLTVSYATPAILAELDEASRNFLRFAQEIAANAQEKFDGSGQPHALVGTDIPLSARLVHVASVYDHLVSSRDYKPALSHAQALAVLREQRGSHFDPDIVDAALAIGDQLQAIAGQYSEPDEN